MSKAEILAELPKLKADERTQVFERLCELQERDLLHGLGPTAEEKKLLDEALAEFERDGQRGEPWRDVSDRLQVSRPSASSTRPATTPGNWNESSEPLAFPRSLANSDRSHWAR